MPHKRIICFGDSITHGDRSIEGDKKLQAYRYRVCLTDAPHNRVMVAKPANYNKKDFELIVRAVQKGVKTFWKLSALPNRKTDSNNDGGVSMDYIYGSTRMEPVFMMLGQSSGVAAANSTFLIIGYH